MTAGQDCGWLLTAAQRGNAAATLGPAWTSGNRVWPLLHGAEYFSRLRAELADCGPGDQVYVCAWRLDPDQPLDGSGATVGAEFAGALRRGAAVHGLVWRAHPGGWMGQMRRSNRTFARQLRSLGGSVLLDQRIRVGGSHHQKFMVIRRPGRPEHDIALLGSMDPGYSRRDDAAHRGDPRRTPMPAAFGDRPSWHDAHLEIRGPAVAQVERCFRERWAHRARASLPPEPAPPPPCGSSTIQLLRTYPRKRPAYPFAPAGEYSVAHGYAQALRNARRLIYVEDQFLWSPQVARVFADALRARPGLRMVVVLPALPDDDTRPMPAVNAQAQRATLDVLSEAGGERVEVYCLESPDGLPIYVHAKLCVIDDVWATVGSANLNQRSFSHDSELTAAVLDDTVDERAPVGSDAEPPRRFARNLRLRLWREHLDRADGDDADLIDAEQGTKALRQAAAELDAWHARSRTGPRPPGRLRRYTPAPPGPLARRFAPLAVRLVFDPAG